MITLGIIFSNFYLKSHIHIFIPSYACDVILLFPSNWRENRIFTNTIYIFLTVQRSEKIARKSLVTVKLVKCQSPASARLSTFGH